MSQLPPPARFSAMAVAQQRGTALHIDRESHSKSHVGRESHRKSQLCCTHLVMENDADSWLRRELPLGATLTQWACSLAELGSGFASPPSTLPSGIPAHFFNSQAERCLISSFWAASRTANGSMTWTPHTILKVWHITLREK
jgi:hypothetical protein